MSNKKIFISYSRVNKDYVKDFVSRLKEGGADIWMDQDSIETEPPGILK